MILPDHRIEVLARAGMIVPYSHKRLQPASYDVSLGDTFKVQSRFYRSIVDMADPLSYDDLMVDRMAINGGFTLAPGEFVLGCTREVVTVPHDISMHIEGKSSLGRLGLVVHATAGFVDPGFHGVLTLELMNWLKSPIILRPGMSIAQVSVSRLESAAREPYAGRYQHDMHAVASRYGR